MYPCYPDKMSHNISMRKFLIVLVSILLVYQLSITVDAQTINYVNKGCNRYDFNYTEGSVYEDNINLLLAKLTSKSSSLKFDNDTVGVDSNKVYGLFQCRDDVRLRVCNECVTNATLTIIEQCYLNGEATVWYYECMLRYSNRNIFSSQDVSFLADRWSKNNVSKYDEFAPILASTMNELIKNASLASTRFSSQVAKLSLFDQLYSFAQCTPDIDTSACSICLKKAFSEMIQCCNASVFVMVFYPSCQLRYDTTSPFLTDQLAPSPPPTTEQGLGTSKKTSLTPAIIGVIAACIIIGLLVLAVVLCICCMCHKKPEGPSTDMPRSSTTWLAEGTVKSDHPDPDGFGDAEFVQYSFGTLKTATSNFSDDNKLGEGGFGSVYKGTLENGDKLAIKRLSATGGQGTKEFMTEARLLAKLQHRNLVKLLGFCSEGDEKLLVYEFMSNASLDGFLFDANKRPLLDWVIRYKIIMAIARGLQYLHEDSRLTIIHRDLKPANILLGKEMNPKIADFGLAKLSGGGQKFGNTVRIVGTQGYMAPEYLMTGDYSDKSDVYSFGIMLLEIVSGRKNKAFNRTQQEDLSIQVWRLWNEGRAFEITDPVLFNKCSSNEVMRCIQIGLLCLQANAEQRPTMTAVVLMLTGSVDLPVPLAPVMSSNQQSMPMNYSGGQQSDGDQYSTMSVTMQTDSHDLYPTPR